VTICSACGTELPADARFCPACGAPVEGAPATEERKLATVLFADLVGSTRLGEQDPERTRALLDRFYEAMATEIQGAGGTVEKFIGDAVMAAFGAPLAHEDHAERALHSALSMQRRLGELFGGDLALRIGVNTGEVVVGRPREGSSFVTGDAVNVAQRLEAAAGPGEILVGERTVSTARGAFEFDEVEPVKAKGKSAPVECRRLVRALTLMRPRGVGELQRAFVGRENELEQLQAAYRRADERAEPQLVTIVGDAGVGKTRLARELWEWFASEPTEPLRRTGRCLSYGHGITYWPLGEVLKEHLGILESDAPELVRQRLAEREILGLTLGLDVASDLHPLAARDRLHDSWIEFFEELARERPLVVLIEDLHWAEQELFDLLERVARDVRGPLLLLASARPELLDVRPGWTAARRNASVLWLEPLSAADSERMVHDLLVAQLPARLREAVVERAEGNPFFVEELIATLIDRDVIARSDDGWTLSELPADFDVPDSVQAVLAARIDLLEPAEKAALQAASVIGRIFWTGPVYELLEGLQPDFRVLEERDFVRRRAGSSMAGEREYAIKHALTREVAYASVPKAKRAQLHARFAAWLEQVSEDRDGLTSLLAHHYAEAVRPEDVDLAWAGQEAEAERLRATAVVWLRRAAELAVGRYEIDEGLGLLHRALELESDEAAQSELWHAIGRAHAFKFDGEAFWTAMQKAVSLSTDERAIADLYSDLALQTSIRAGMWRKRPDLELVQGWIDRALEGADPESPARVKALVATALWVYDVAVAARAAAQASSIAERLGDPELRSTAWGARSLVAFGSLDYDNALTWAQRQFEIIDNLRDPDLRCDAYWNTLLPSVAKGRFREARRLAAGHDEIAARLTAHHRVHGVGVLLELEEVLGGWERIAELESRVVEDVEANLDTPCVRNARSLLLCALARLHAGDEQRARELEERGEEISTEGHRQTYDGPRIQLALARGDLEQVERLLVETDPMHWTFFLATKVAVLDGAAAVGRRELVEAESEPVLKPGTCLEPFALRALGIVREDEELLRRAIERFEAMRLAWHAEQTRALLTR
jgi:class 3 adenylate cyclase